MSSPHAVEDHEHLRQTAIARMRRARRVGTAVALVIFLGVVLVSFLLAGQESWSLGEIALLLAAPLVGVALLLVLFRHLGAQERDPQVLSGAGRADQRAVEGALRAGRSADPRIDALARDEARRTVRRRWVPWLYVSVVVLQAGLMVLNVIEGDGRQQVSFGLLLILWCVLLWQLLARRRRSRRYLGGPAGEA